MTACRQTVGSRIGNDTEGIETPAELYYNVPGKSMGKRELLLIVAFVIVGAVVYQATAPPAGPNDRGVSLSALSRQSAPGNAGKSGKAEITKVSTHELDAQTTELRFPEDFRRSSITGEKRDNIEARVRDHLQRVPTMPTPNSWRRNRAEERPRRIRRSGWRSNIQSPASSERS